MAFLKNSGNSHDQLPAGRGKILSLLICLFLQVDRAHAQPLDVEIKAAFIYHFSQFVEWPTNAFADSDSPLVIGVLGKDPFGQRLDALVKGEMIRGRPLEVRRFSEPAAALGAHILFISQSEEREWGAILEALGKRPVLTVSEIDNFTTRGGIIQFYTSENRVRLRINNHNANRVGLSLSSKLLRVAEVTESD